MQLIKTNDGLIGLKLINKIIWCDTQAELANFMWHSLSANAKETNSLERIASDVSYAITYMTEHNHDIAEFGFFGAFIYSHKEEMEDKID